MAGASFDNNVICTDEKEAIVVDAVADRLLRAMAAQRSVRTQTTRAGSAGTSDLF